MPPDTNSGGLNSHYALWDAGHNIHEGIFLRVATAKEDGSLKSSIEVPTPFITAGTLHTHVRS
jgi:hypothetical protein